MLLSNSILKDPFWFKHSSKRFFPGFDKNFITLLSGKGCKLTKTEGVCQHFWIHSKSPIFLNFNNITKLSSFIQTGMKTGSKIWWCCFLSVMTAKILACILYFCQTQAVSQVVTWDLTSHPSQHLSYTATAYHQNINTSKGINFTFIWEGNNFVQWLQKYLVTFLNYAKYLYKLL